MAIYGCGVVAFGCVAWGGAHMYVEGPLMQRRYLGMKTQDASQGWELAVFTLPCSGTEVLRVREFWMGTCPSQSLS